jgi:hypothetical protein
MNAEPGEVKQQGRNSGDGGVGVLPAAPVRVVRRPGQGFPSAAPPPLTDPAPDELAQHPAQVSMPATSQSPSTFSIVIVTQFL